MSGLHGDPASDLFTDRRIQEALEKPGLERSWDDFFENLAGAGRNSYSIPLPPPAAFDPARSPIGRIVSITGDCRAADSNFCSRCRVDAADPR